MSLDELKSQIDAAKKEFPPIDFPSRLRREYDNAHGVLKCSCFPNIPVLHEETEGLSLFIPGEPGHPV